MDPAEVKARITCQKQNLSELTQLSASLQALVAPTRQIHSLSISPSSGPDVGEAHRYPRKV